VVAPLADAAANPRPPSTLTSPTGVVGLRGGQQRVRKAAVVAPPPRRGLRHANVQPPRGDDLKRGGATWKDTAPPPPVATGGVGVAIAEAATNRARSASAPARPRWAPTAFVAGGGGTSSARGGR